MGQVLHGCATTTEAIRRAIHHSQESLMWTAVRGQVVFLDLATPPCLLDQSPVDVEKGPISCALMSGLSRGLPLAIMGVRLRVRHQSEGRARGHRLSFGVARTVLTTAFPITPF